MFSKNNKNDSGGLTIGGTFLKKGSPYFTLALIFLLTFFCLYYFRAADDNRLTSWLWAFEGVSAVKAAVVLIVSLAGAFVLSRFPMPGLKGVFIASFAMSAFFWKEPEVIVDAARYFTAAKHLELYGIGYFLREWGRAIPAWTDLPLLPFLYGLIFRYAGETRVYIQIFTSLLFSLTALLTALTGRELWGARANGGGAMDRPIDGEVWQTSGLLLLGMPYLFSQTPLMLVDVASMFFLMLSVYAFVRALRAGGIRIGLAAVSVALSILTKYSLWPMLSVLFVVFAAELGRGPQGFQPRAPRIPLKRGVLVFLIAGLIAGPVFLYRFDFFSGQIGLLLSYQRPGLRRWTEGWVSTFLFQVHPLITAAALYSIYEALRRRDFGYAVVFWLPLLMFVFRIERIRYVIPVFPMAALMAAYGMEGIRPAGLRRFMVEAIVLTSFAVALFAYLPLLGGMSMGSLKAAGEDLDAMEEKTVMVVTLPQESPINPAVSVPILDYYTKKEILYEYAEAVPPGDVEVSPFRFSWQYGNSPYYEASGTGLNQSGFALAVISDKPAERAPDKYVGYRLYRVFDTDERLFRFRTAVTVFRVE